MAKSKALPKEVFVRWEQMEDEGPYLNVYDNLSDSAPDGGERAVVGVYKLVGTKNVRRVTEITDAR